jgi:hypothetical protein
MNCSLKLKRKIFTDNSTIGELYINGVFFCHTLEDKDRDTNKNKYLEEGKIYGQTAIPAGFYKVILNMSNRFKRILPLLINVEGFEGVRIHNGNTKKDTEGCILVGTWDGKTKDFIGNSRVTTSKLLTELKKYEKIDLTIDYESK